MARASRAYSLSSLQFGSYARAEKAERIEIAFEVSPLAEGVEDAFALGIRAVVGRGFE